VGPVQQPWQLAPGGFGSNLFHIESVHASWTVRTVQGLLWVGKEELGLSAPTAGCAVGNLEALGIVKELTGRRRDRVYAYRRYIAILNEGGDPL